MSKYNKQYQQIKAIGRGSYGTAHLVRRKIDNYLFVAKKMHLQGMKQKQQISAEQEVKILQKLNSHFIVKYIDSFLDNGQLIIIMQYCEDGDLTFFIKTKKKSNQLIEQNVITNWLIQLLFGLKTIQTNKILHRDIKSSNIFLTSNRTIKIGDFGISKVLQTIHQEANTFVGTPYYLSPEVCEGKPYGYKSDIWALGCVIYELCTLNYAFSANSLLGLANKIVKDKVERIPSLYSNDLADLVNRLLSKKESERPSINQILHNKLIQKNMESFINMIDRGENLNINVPIKVTEVHKVLKQDVKSVGLQQTKNSSISNLNSSTLNYTETMNTIQSQMIDSLTPAQKLKLKKQAEAKKRIQQLNLAVKNTNTNEAKLRKNEELSDSMSGSKYREQISKKKVILHDQISKIIQNNQQQRKKMMQTTQKSSFNNSQTGQLNLKNIQTINTAYETVYQQIPLPTTTHYVKYNKTEQQELQQYYDEKFEQYQQQEVRLTSRAPESDLQKINTIYKQELKNAYMNESPKKKVVEQEPKAENNIKLIRMKKIENCKNRIGKSTFENIYLLMKELDEQQVPHNEIYGILQKRFGKDKKGEYQIIEYM